MMKLPYLRRLLTLLVFYDVLIFKPVGIPHPTFDLDGGKIAATTDGPPKVPALKSLLDVDYCNQLLKCPDTDEDSYFRKLCFNNCPPGEFYHCGVDEDHQTVVEFCYPKYPCGKGYYGTPKVNGKVVTMACIICPKDRFNPERRLSPENMDQCSSHFHISPEPHSVQFLPGNNTDPAVYFCNATDGWASSHRTLFCRPSYKPCSCVFKGDSCHGEDLLPDMRCVPKCVGERPPEKNFSCFQRKVSQTKSKVESSTNAMLTTLKTTTSKTTLLEDDPTSSPVPVSFPDSDDLSKGELIAICFGVVIVLAILIVAIAAICVTKHVICCKTTHNVKNIGGDYIDTGRAHQVNLNVASNERSTSSISAGSDDRDTYAMDDQAQQNLLNK